LDQRKERPIFDFQDSFFMCPLDYVARARARVIVGADSSNELSGQPGMDEHCHLLSKHADNQGELGLLPPELPHNLAGHGISRFSKM